MIEETKDAGKQRLGRDEALGFARKAARIVAMKGKKRVELDLASGPTDEEILAVLLGPTGNMRAPALWVSGTLVVGFDPDVYEEVLAG